MSRVPQKTTVLQGIFLRFGGLLCSSFTSGSLFGKFSNPDRVSVVQTDHSMVSENVEYKSFRQSASCLAQVQLHAGGESSHCPSAPALSRRRQWQWPNWPSDSRCRLRVCSSKWTLGVSMTVQPRTGDTVTCFQMDSLSQITSQDISSTKGRIAWPKLCIQGRSHCRRQSRLLAFRRTPAFH